MAETKNSNETTTEALIVDTDYSVLVVEKKDLQAFFLDTGKLDALYGHVEKMARALVADPLTKEGASQIKSCARQIASVKKRIDDIGKDVVAELKKLPGQIDTNRKNLRERLEALQDDIRRPVTEIENREDEIDGIKGIHLRLANASSGEIAKELEFVKKIPLTEEKWHESLEKAKAAIAGETKALELLKSTAEKREKDAEELEQLRKNQEEADRIIRENKIKEEARAEGFAQGKAAAAPTAPANATVRPPIPAPEPSPSPAPTAPQAPAQATMSKTLTPAKPSAWTQAQKDINNAIVDAIAKLISTKLEGFTEPGYKLAAQEIVKAVIKGKINNLKVVY